MTVFNCVPKDQFTPALQTKLTPEDPARTFFKFGDKAVVVLTVRDKTVLKVYSEAIGWFRTIELDESITSLSESYLHVQGKDFWWAAIKSKHIYIIRGNSPDPERLNKEPELPFYFSSEKFFYFSSPETLIESSFNRGGLTFHSTPPGEKGELLFAGPIIVYRKFNDESYCLLDVYSYSKRRFLRNIPITFGIPKVRLQDEGVEITFESLFPKQKDSIRLHLETGEIIS